MKFFIKYPAKINGLKEKLSEKVSLRMVLVTACVLQIFGTVTLISYLSFKNSQRTVNEIANQLQNEIILRVEENLTAYLQIAQEINQDNLGLVNLGVFNLQNLSAWDGYLWKKVQQFPQISVIGVANKKGEYRAAQHLKNGLITLNIIDQSTDFNFHAYQTNEQGDKTHLVKIIKNIDMRQRPWYQEALKAGKPVWSQVHPALVEPILLISVAAPIYKQSSQDLEGAIMTTVGLDHLGEFLQGLKIGKQGQVFIIDRAGNLVATSTQEPLFTLKGKEKILIPMNESHHQITQETAAYLINKFGNFNALKELQSYPLTLNGKKQFLKVKSYRNKQGLDWFIIMVIPEADFMESINNHNTITVILCIVALIISIIISIFIVRWITQPILTLNQAAKKITQGEWEHNLEVINRGDEVGELAKSFQSMAEQLQDSLTTLEQRVNERTSELLEINYQLEITKEEAEIANQAKSTFIANMSHELRSPLNAIIGFSQLMTREKDLPPEYLKNVSIINQSGEYLLTLINNILDLSKIEAGKMILNPNNFDLYRLVEDLEDMFYLRAENKDIKLEFERVNPIPQYVRTDEIKLRQVLINLLSNAIKFTASGKITVKVASEQKEDLDNSQSKIYFSVEDTGVGIAPQELAYLFEAFSQTQSGKDTQEGTGLGLAISRKFVQLLGGNITVTSTVGKGTLFSFDIQVTIVKASDLDNQHPQRRVIALAPHQPCYKILVVDDKPVNCQLIVKLLSPLGFNVREAYNGQQALEIWDEWEPHLIWMDMRMPVIDGYEATKRIKDTTKGNATAVIALTASVLEEEKAVVLSAGCDDFMRKPFQESQIFQAMAKHLGVQYIYEELISKPQENPLTEKELTPASLAVLGSDWLAEFHQGVTQGDITMIHSLIEQIPTEQQRLAIALKDLVDRYDFDRLLNLTQAYVQSGKDELNLD